MAERVNGGHPKLPSRASLVPPGGFPSVCGFCPLPLEMYYFPSFQKPRVCLDSLLPCCLIHPSLSPMTVFIPHFLAPLPGLFFSLSITFCHIYLSFTASFSKWIQASAKSVQNIIILFWAAQLEILPLLFPHPPRKSPTVQYSSSHAKASPHRIPALPHQCAPTPRWGDAQGCPPLAYLACPPLAYLAWSLWRDLILDPEEVGLYDCYCSSVVLWFPPVVKAVSYPG